MAPPAVPIQTSSRRHAGPGPGRPRASPAQTLRIALLAVLFTLSAVAAHAGGGLDDADRMAIRDVIRAQLDAFQADDAERAFSYATPEIQRKSGTPQAFLAMVREAYAPIYRPSAVFFQDVTVMDGMVTQRVLVMDAAGAPVLAVYPVERQPDGQWRIAGCMLYRGDSRML